VVTAEGTWDFEFEADGSEAEARVTMVWKKYPKVTINGETFKVSAPLIDARCFFDWSGMGQ
jgi:hypothetical protein